MSTSEPRAVEAARPCASTRIACFNPEEPLTPTQVEGFARYMNNLRLPSQLQKNANYHMFKNGIKPMWEDTANAKVSGEGESGDGVRAPACLPSCRSSLLYLTRRATLPDSLGGVRLRVHYMSTLTLDLRPRLSHRYPIWAHRLLRVSTSRVLTSNLLVSPCYVLYPRIVRLATTYRLLALPHPPHRRPCPLTAILAPTFLSSTFSSSRLPTFPSRPTLRRAGRQIHPPLPLAPPPRPRLRQPHHGADRRRPRPRERDLRDRSLPEAQGGQDTDMDAREGSGEG
jgi:hypothetical protein